MQQNFNGHSSGEPGANHHHASYLIPSNIDDDGRYWFPTASPETVLSTAFNRCPHRKEFLSLFPYVYIYICTYMITN